MFDIFNFPNINKSDKPEKQIEDIVNYLIQFKETLEFELANISLENLSPELTNKLDSLSSAIDHGVDGIKEEFSQRSTGNLTVSDVCNSELFKSYVKTSVEGEISKQLTFTVNFETGHLEYGVE